MKSLPVAWDIIVFGVVMIVSGMADLYIIVRHPLYSLPFFGTTLQGISGALIKGVHPVIHFVSGYGAIYGRRWAYRLFMAYAAYGLVNAMVNRLLLPPPHRIRTIFMIGTLIVAVYLILRKKQFER